MAVADRTQQILPGGQKSAPFSYVIPGSTSFTLLAVRATLDGSAAASAWLPCVQIISDAGVVMAQTVGSSVAAGASADVTFAPFLEAATAAGTGGGINFDTFPQAGNWLYVETDSEVGSPHGYGMQLIDVSAGGMELDTIDASLSLGQTFGLGKGAVLDSATGISIHGHGTGEVAVTNTDANGIRIEDTHGSSSTGVLVKSDNGPIFVDAKDTLGLFAENTKATLASNNPTVGLGMFLELDNQSLILYTKGGTRIMQIDFDGVNWNYHIQTGSAWVADL